MKSVPRCLILSIAAFSCSGALAQVAPPPGPAPAPTPEWKPAPKSAAPKAVPDQAVNKEVQKRWEQQTPLQELPYKSLVERDASGNLIYLKEPAQIVALRNNPSIDEVTRKRLVGVLAHRQAKIDRLAIDNLDLVDKIEGGAIDRIDAPDVKAYLKSLLDLTKPLRPADGELNYELRTSGQISFDQARWTQRLLQEYTRAASDEARKAKKPGTTANKFAEIQRIEETLAAYPRMLVEASRSLDKTVPQLGLSAETTKKIDPAVKSLAGDVPDAKREETMRAMSKDLTLPQRQDLLRKTIALRPLLPAVEPAPDRSAAPAPAVPVGSAPASAGGEAAPADKK